MERRTLEALRKEAEKKGLVPGATVEVVTVKENQDEGSRGKNGPQRKLGTVTELHSHIFVCDMGQFKQCFRYNEFLGNEAGRKVRLRGF